MGAEKVVLRVTETEEGVLAALVDNELDRRIEGIDSLIQQVYDVVPAKHTEPAIAQVRAAILSLVRSPLADLERKLACAEVEPEPEPAAEVKPEVEAPPAEEPKPEEAPGKSKA